VVVSWQLRGEAESYAPTSRTDEKGIATTTVKSHTAGLLQMTAYLDADNHIQADNVTVVAGDIKNATFSADKTTIGSDGEDTVTFTTSLEDTWGNPVMGKTVIIEGAASLAGFKLSKVQDQQNGRYVATGTATTKGQVTLSAYVDGTKVGNPVTVTVGAITPELRFDNSDQLVTWTRNFTASQAVRGMPEGVEQMWSSSDTSVATVDVNGKVTLLKSGSARISVYTPGNEQYNQAMASYNLGVSRADPGLKAGTGDPITAVWADGKERNITATYTNSDVQGGLKATYSAKSETVVKVDDSGKLTAVKPGATTVTVSTPETDQFLAASADVAYVLNKATADVSFDTSVVKTTDEDAFTLQEPVTTLTSQASIQWTSSNTNVINVSGSGAIQGNVDKGQTRLTLTVLANDYYNASSGYYDVMVYTKPSVNLGEVSYISKGSKGSSGTWTPVFTDDTLSVTWSADTSDEFSKPESVTVYFLDGNDNVLASKEESTPSGSQTTTLDPDASLWNKTVHVALVAKGYGSLQSSKLSSSVKVENLRPEQIWTTASLSTFILGYGRTTWLESSRAKFLYKTLSIKIADGKTLLSPMSMNLKGVKLSGDGSFGSYDSFSIKTGSYTTAAYQSGHIIDSDLWTDHYGTYKLQLNVEYSGDNYLYETNSYYWEGSTNRQATNTKTW
jgi:adhesin/invasin